MHAQREKILQVLYDEHKRSPLQTLSIDNLAVILSTASNDLWRELSYLQEKGFIAITEHHIGTRVFRLLRLTAIGIEHVERGAFTQPDKADKQVSHVPIFISHSQLDEDFCLRMLAYLDEHMPSADIFYDAKCLYAGDEWVRRIPQEVLTRSIFVVVLSPHAVESPWVREEVTLAIREAMMSEQRRIVPVLCQTCDIDQLSPILRSRQVIDCSGQNELVGFSRLRSALTL